MNSWHKTGPAEMSGYNPAPWTTEEQKLLEQALKTYPSNTPERWDKIAQAIPNRSKKDCIKRYKVSRFAFYDVLKQYIFFTNHIYMLKNKCVKHMFTIHYVDLLL